MYFIYVLRNPEGRLYIGFTANLDQRVLTHQQNEGGWTAGKGPWELVHSESFEDRNEALKRERNLKRGKQNQELRHRFNEISR